MSGEATFSRRNALARAAQTAIAAGAATLIGGSAIAAEKIPANNWAMRMDRNRKLLAPYFRSLADAIEKDSVEPLDAYRKANPDYPVDQPGGPQKMKKICWPCIGRVLIALGHLMGA